MVRMKHATFGTDMWVAENRVDEYKAAGHILAADSQKSEKPAEVTDATEEAPADEPKPKRTRKK